MEVNPRRESFYALYWDQARDIPKFIVCQLARLPVNEIVETSSRSWDELLQHERDALRAAILQLIELHDSNRKELARIRELNGTAPVSPQQTNGAIPDEKRSLQADR